MKDTPTPGRYFGRSRSCQMRRYRVGSRWPGCLMLGIALAGAPSGAPPRAVELLGPSPINFPFCPEPLCIPSQVVAVDINGDGALDLAIAGHPGSRGRILFGDGLGGFKSEDIVDGSFFAPGDCDADGDTALAVVDSSLGGLPNTVSILQCDGTGRLARTASVVVGTYTQAISVGDLDSDGAMDLAVVNAGAPPLAGWVSVLIGNGLGGFSNVRDIPVGIFPKSITLGDFDSDGDADLAVTNRGPYCNQAPDPGSVSILLGDGRGEFARGADVQVGYCPVAIAGADLNNDGATDFVVANEDRGGTLSILEGDGRGAFSLTDLPVKGT